MRAPTARVYVFPLICTVVPFTRVSVPVLAPGKEGLIGEGRTGALFAGGESAQAALSLSEIAGRTTISDPIRTWRQRESRLFLCPSALAMMLLPLCTPNAVRYFMT